MWRCCVIILDEFSMYFSFQCTFVYQQAFAKPSFELEYQKWSYSHKTIGHEWTTASLKTCPCLKSKYASANGIDIQIKWKNVIITNDVLTYFHALAWNDKAKSCHSQVMQQFIRCPSENNVMIVFFIRHQACTLQSHHFQFSTGHKGWSLELESLWC